LKSNINGFEEFLQFPLNTPAVYSAFVAEITVAAL